MSDSPYKGKYEYEVYVRTNRNGSRCSEVFSALNDHTEQEWDELTEEEQIQYLEDVAADVKLNLYEWGWKAVEGKE